MDIKDDASRLCDTFQGQYNCESTILPTLVQTFVRWSPPPTRRWLRSKDQRRYQGGLVPFAGAWPKGTTQGETHTEHNQQGRFQQQNCVVSFTMSNEVDVQFIALLSPQFL